MWKLHSLEGGQIGLQVSYHFDWKTIEGISRVLDKVQRSEGATLEEEREHRQLRTDAVANLEPERTPRDRSRGLSL